MLVRLMDSTLIAGVESIRNMNMAYLIFFKDHGRTAMQVPYNAIDQVFEA